MDTFFDKLGDFIQSLVSGRSTHSTKASADSDYQAAWDELDEYLHNGKSTQSDSRSHFGDQHAGDDQWRARPGDCPSEDLRQDYGNLGVPFDAPFAQVKQAYKKLLREYHPDKHAGDPEKQRVATEITKRINESFARIRASSPPG